LKSELRAVVSLALLYAIRMLGLFMVLPVLSIAGLSYELATAATIGLALGIYGLTQSLFQIPLGMLSDFIGRKPVIIFGLVLFAIGSLIAAYSTSVYGLILGRALQGAGAIASTVMALVSDLTSEENRTKAMASIGASIGLSFMVAMVLGPLLSGPVGLDGIFIFTFVLSIVGILLVIFVVPSPPIVTRSHRDAGAIPSLLIDTAKKPDLLRLNVGIFTLHAVLTAIFIVVPSILLNELDMPIGTHWKVYCSVLLGSFVAMLPIMILAEKKNKAKEAFLFAIAVLSVSFALFSQAPSGVFVFVLFLFFVAFNLLEAMLPSWVSKVAPAGVKGTAMGLYSTWQFMGAFVGGVAGGIIVSKFDTQTLFVVCGLGCMLWFIVACFMNRPKKLSGLSFQLRDEAVADFDFAGFEGVEDAAYASADQMLYLKVDKTRLDLEALKIQLDKYA